MVLVGSSSSPAALSSQPQQKELNDSVTMGKILMVTKELLYEATVLSMLYVSNHFIYTTHL